VIVAGATPVADGDDGTPPPAQPPTYNGGATPARSVRLGELLVRRGLVSEEQLDHALAEQVVSGRRLGAELLRLGMVSERDLIETLAEQVHLPVADLRLTSPSPEAIDRLPEEAARRLEVVPIRMVGEMLEVAVADVLHDALRADLEAAAGCQVIAVLAPPSEIRLAIDRTYVVIDDVNQHVETFEKLAAARPKQELATFDVDANAPVVQVVSLLLTQAVRDRASDIHIEPQGDRVRVRFRIDGVMREVSELPETMAQPLVSRLKVMAGMNIVERRRPQDGQIQTEVDGRHLDVRVATAATIFGEKAVLRLLDTSRGQLSLGELGMPKETAHAMGQMIQSPFGMIVCAGPTGSGKTTTLYAALNAIDDPSRNITTIEDPVEYVVPTITQIQVNNQAGVTFAEGLRSILRQDPDVVLIGEMRDIETANIAVQSALTGHLVLSSIHATDTATAVQRFRDMGIESFLITSSLLGVMSQRLLRRICSHCREQYTPTSSELALYEHHTGQTKDVFYRGAGCNLCSHTGYADRIGIYELLQVTDPIRDLVLRDAGAAAIRRAAVAGGMRTLEDEAMALVTNDVTTIAEATRTVVTK